MQQAHKKFLGLGEQVKKYVTMSVQHPQATLIFLSAPHVARELS